MCTTLLDFSESYLACFNTLYVLRKNNFCANCASHQTEVNSKAPIDLKTPGLYFLFLFLSLNEFYCADHVTDQKCGNKHIALSCYFEYW